MQPGRVIPMSLRVLLRNEIDIEIPFVTVFDHRLQVILRMLLKVDRGPRVSFIGRGRLRVILAQNKFRIGPTCRRVVAHVRIGAGQENARRKKEGQPSCLFHILSRFIEGRLGLNKMVCLPRGDCAVAWRAGKRGRARPRMSLQRIRGEMGKSHEQNIINFSSAEQAFRDTNGPGPDPHRRRVRIISYTMGPRGESEVRSHLPTLRFPHWNSLAVLGD